MAAIRKFRRSPCMGGVAMRTQIRALAGGVDIVVATPGRLIDLLNRKAISLGRVEIPVLDESDRMLDIGFVKYIRLLRRASRRSGRTSFSRPPCRARSSTLWLTSWPTLQESSWRLRHQQPSGFISKSCLSKTPKRLRHLQSCSMEVVARVVSYSRAPSTVRTDLGNSLPASDFKLGCLWQQVAETAREHRAGVPAWSDPDTRRDRHRGPRHRH